LTGKVAEPDSLAVARQDGVAGEYAFAAQDDGGVRTRTERQEPDLGQGAEGDFLTVGRCKEFAAIRFGFSIRRPHLLVEC